MKTDHQAGFTLAELLIALLVASALMAMAQPSFAKLIAKNRQTITANELLYAFQGARLLALTRNQTVGVCAGNREDACHGDWSRGEWIRFIDENRDGNFGAQEILHATGQLPSPETMRFSSNGPFKKTVVFRPSGEATWPSGAFGAGRISICSEAILDQGVELVMIGSGRTVLQPLADCSH